MDLLKCIVGVLLGVGLIFLALAISLSCDTTLRYVVFGGIPTPSDLLPYYAVASVLLLLGLGFVYASRKSNDVDES